MLKLDRIQLSGYKSIREMKLELGELNVLIGANGSGKSNFISFFKLLNRLTNGELRFFVGEAGGANSLLHFGMKQTPVLDVQLDFSTEKGTNLYSARLAGAAEDTLIFADEKISFTKQGNSPKHPVSIGSGHKESRLRDLDIPEFYKKTADAILKMMGQWRFYQFHDTSRSAAIKQKSDISNCRYLSEDAGNLASYLWMLKTGYPDYYRRVVGVIRQIAPFFDDFILEPDALNPDKIMLQWKDCERGMTFNAGHLSDGTLRMMALVTLLLQPQPPSLICIDEPELGLHPFAIRILSELIQNAAAKSQVIVSTQSSQLVDYMEPEQLIVVDRENGQSVFKKLESGPLEEWLSEYSLGELWEKNIFGGRPSL